jgi:hypothetical protein
MKTHTILSSVLAIAKRSATKLSVGLAATTTLLSIALPTLAQPASLSARNAESWINVRSNPSVDASVNHYGRVGDRVDTLRQTQTSDGYIWYYVAFANTGAEGWVREDLLTLENNTTDDDRANSTTSNTQGGIILVSRPASTTPQPDPSPSQPDFRGYTQEQINYFLEVAMGAEFGSSNSSIRKWSGPIRIKVNGTPTQTDLATLRAVVSELNDLTEGIELQITDSNPNMEIYFVPESQFSRYEPNYRPVNMGFFWTWWSNNILNRARILITTEGVTQQERSHLIREELTQSLGLMQDSNRYSDSIFYQRWTDVIAYTDLDRAVISILYRPEIHSGMNRNQVIAALQQINLAQNPTR